ncbi:GATS protein-like 3 [Basidiobolus ranarum]|uniref:GATS protein-like 3 n=1 Tax=Basidiobolus ranarum TaxID=34480 RepID=A0ABR2VZN4_9FUNG
MSDLEVCILPYRLKLASIAKENLSICAHTIIKLLLFPNEGKEFFSFTETPSSISLIIDEAAIETFPAEAKVGVSSTVFIPFQIQTGQSGTVPVLHSIAVPLANNGISILQLSTYETDYTLIPEELVKKALSCFPPTFVIRDESQLFEDAISNIQSPFFNAKRNSVNGSSLSMQIHQFQDGDATNEKQWTDSEFLSKIATSEQITNLRRVVSFPDCPVYVTSLAGSVEAVQDTMSIPLINLLFFSDDRQRGDRFFSFTRTSENASLILSEPCLSLFPPGSLNFCGGAWSILKIEDVAFAFEQCGIVRDCTERLKNLGISIFYLTTYHTDYLLVNQEDYHAVMNALVHYDSLEISN